MASTSRPILETAEWPRSLVRVRGQDELAEIATHGGHFEVLVADDADELDARVLDQFAAAGTRVHRIGSAREADAIVLEIPHRQTNSALADLVSERPGHWLAGPGGMGLVVREAGDLDVDFLQSEASRIVTILRDAGASVALAPLGRDAVADIVVAAVDVLSDDDVRHYAKAAREGVAILCRRDQRRPEPVGERPLPPDATAARSLGWRVKQVSSEGALLEKDDWCVALVNEPAALTGGEELVTDVVDRLSSLGWRPIVAWQDAPRDPHALDSLLDTHSVPVARDQSFRRLVERFELLRQAPHTKDSTRTTQDSGTGAPTEGRTVEVSAVPTEVDAAPTEAADPEPAAGAATFGQTCSLGKGHDRLLQHLRITWRPSWGAAQMCRPRTRA